MKRIACLLLMILGLLGLAHAAPEVGSIITFGQYEQDNNKKNGAEPIEWLVLDYDADANQALLISKYALEVRPYNGTRYYPTWAKSYIRTFLNEQFLEEAFTQAEQERLVPAKLSTPSFHGNGGGADTEDKVWLLSRDEAETYFPDSEARKVLPTAYAAARGGYRYDGTKERYCLNGQGCCWWWLRSPGDFGSNASIVLDDGALGSFYVYRDQAVRPVICLRPDNTLADLIREVLAAAAASTAPETPSPTPDPTRTPDPTATPTAAPTAVPTAAPTAAPTAVPTAAPTATPTTAPTAVPTAAPSAAPKPAAVPASEPIRVGDTLFYGRYEQDNKQANGPEPIEWLVLDYDAAKGQALLISKYGLDSKRYDGGDLYPTWEKSELRAWLNDDFLNAAFTEEEKLRIVETRVSTPAYEGNSGGAPTIDRIWLLSREEAETYFPSDSDRSTQPTAYAKAHGAWVSANGTCWWWLRSPGHGTGTASGITASGDFGNGNPVTNAQDIARPVFLLQLDPGQAAAEPAAPAANEAAEPEQPIRVGDTLFYGRYEQDNDPANGPEPIEWLVLDYDAAKGQAVLLSKAGLDARPYDSGSDYPTWEKSGIRAWLNGEFLDLAFTAEEQAGIVTAQLSTPAYEGNDGGADTADRLWLLSRDEAAAFIGPDAARAAEPTAYAYANGAYKGSNGGSWWWLRSPGGVRGSASIVDSSGSFDFDTVSGKRNVVRPAFLLNVDAAAPKPAASLWEGDPTQKSSTVTFGRLEQDNDPSNGAEPIAWLVLDYDAGQNRALLISQNALDARSFDRGSKYPTWEKSGIRAWLNGDFLQAAFTAEEQAGIITTLLSTPAYGGRSGGEDTADKIWLLSRDEASAYFKKDGDRRTQPTAQARANGAWASSDGFSWWWLRSPGGSDSASGIRGDGSLSNFNVNSRNGTVRPALWLDLSAGH